MKVAENAKVSHASVASESHVDQATVNVRPHGYPSTGAVLGGTLAFPFTHVESSSGQAGIFHARQFCCYRR
jgi:hypothetical protein